MSHNFCGFCQEYGSPHIHRPEVRVALNAEGTGYRHAHELGSVIVDLLAALKRSAEAAHALTGNPVCERHSLRECPTSYCALAHAAIDKAEKPITS